MKSGQVRSGFTLIELLVVIAIIAILAAILFPVLVSVKASAKKTQCASNIKQLCNACRLYADSWNGEFPEYNSMQGLGSPLPSTTLMPYVKNKGVFVCPVNVSKTDRTNLEKKGPRVTWVSNYWSYTWNIYIAKQYGGVKVMESYPRPSAVALITGDRTIDAYGHMTDPITAVWGKYTAWGPARVAFPHNGGTTVAFLDGHCQSLSMDDERWCGKDGGGGVGALGSTMNSRQKYFWFGK